MVRILVGAVVGVVVWWAIVIVLDFALRFAWHDYAAVEKAMTFTVPMMTFTVPMMPARLAESGIGSILCGMIAAVIGRDRRRPALAAGIILLVLFAPIHYSLWNKFPIWYHLTFLSSLVVLSVVGGYLTRPRRRIFQAA